MKHLFLTTFFIFLFALCVSAQKTEVEQSFVDDSARCFTEVVALRDENKTVKDANEALRIEIQRLQIELAKASVRATELEKQAVENRALINLMVPRLRKKCNGLCLQIGD